MSAFATVDSFFESSFDFESGQTNDLKLVLAASYTGSSALKGYCLEQAG